jgi:meso-butanediol dehydrogenase / (S,S)-butanediol dehydrogenase / diacetyl reductase
MDLEGAVSVVTGAASGIGRATAAALAHAGADVVVADLDGAGIEIVATEIEGTGRRSFAIRADLSRREEVEAFVEQAIAWQGRCDVFVANVGVGCVGAPHDFSVKEWEHLLAVNLWSAIWPLRIVLPHMLERRTGRLVFLSSGAGFEGTSESAPYNVAKFGLVGLSESVARYLKGTGVGVSLVVPGAVATAGWKNHVIAGAEQLEAQEIERRRTAMRDHMSGWPPPEVMADAIVEGIRTDRYCIVQDNPYEADWLRHLLERKGRDPDGFVLG